jgi:hypothetical protein
MAVVASQKTGTHYISRPKTVGCKGSGAGKASETSKNELRNMGFSNIIRKTRQRKYSSSDRKVKT